VVTKSGAIHGACEACAPVGAKRGLDPRPEASAFRAGRRSRVIVGQHLWKELRRIRCHGLSVCPLDEALCGPLTVRQLGSIRCNSCGVHRISRKLACCAVGRARRPRTVVALTKRVLVYHISEKKRNPVSAMTVDRGRSGVGDIRRYAAVRPYSAKARGF